MTPPSSPAPRAPSRELDAEIAERVMGWTADQFRYHAVEREGNSPYHASFGMGDATLAEITAACAHYASRRFRPEVANVPEYSTDIAAAWQVVEKMRELEYSIVIGTNAWAPRQNGAKFFKAVHGIGHCIFDGDSHPGHEAVDETIPLAICRAALAALAPPRAPLEGE